MVRLTLNTALAYKLISLILAGTIALSACAQAEPVPASSTMPPIPSNTPTEAPTNTPTQTPTETQTPTPEVKNYGICEMENFRECPIPAEDLFNGEYLKFLETLSTPFDPDNMKVVRMSLLSLPNEIAYSVQTSPNFEGVDTIGQDSGADFRRGITSGITTFEGRDYMVVPVEYFDPANPEKNVWVIGVLLISDHNESQVTLAFDVWRNLMKVPVIRTSPDPRSTGINDPLAGKTFTEDPNMPENFENFVAGSRSGLHGKVLLTAFFYGNNRSPIKWYN